ncbi:hypothetical protein BASA82_000221 [Batrachochytrium salamandrivorans]|nr:hypothetical protein BASA82_000221 [Batrachochytrium salamandrivorans]
MIYELVPSSPSSAPAASTDKSGAGFAKKIDWALLALCCCNAVDAVETLAFSCILTGYINPGTGTRVDQNPVLSALLTSSVFVGMLVGGLAAGWAADRLGRKPVLLLCMMGNGASALGSATASILEDERQVYWLVGFRFLGGLGVGGSVPCVFALVAELTATSSSPMRSSTGKRITLLSTCWTFGAVFTSLLAWLVMDSTDNTRTWPMFFVMCSLPAWLAWALVWGCVTERTREEVQVVEEETSRTTTGLIPLAVVFFVANFGSYGP